MYPSLTQGRPFFINYPSQPPNQTPKPDNRYRFYTCELKWNHWDCKKGFDVKISNTSLLSRVVPVYKYWPEFLDPIFISFSLPNSVLVRPESSQYTHTSWEEAAPRKVGGSSE